jgi:hypothetical protein
MKTKDNSLEKNLVTVAIYDMMAIVASAISLSDEVKKNKQLTPKTNKIIKDLDVRLETFRYTLKTIEDLVGKNKKGKSKENKKVTNSAQKKKIN